MGEALSGEISTCAEVFRRIKDIRENVCSGSERTVRVEHEISGSRERFSSIPIPSTVSIIRSEGCK
jgi:hypothetical protein